MRVPAVGQRRRALWGGLLAACVVATLLVAMGPSRTATVAPEVTQTESVRVLQMNLCNSGLAGCYTGRSVATAADVIRAQDPDVVTLNEVCQADVAVLARGGPSAFRAVLDSRTGGVTHCRNGDAYGIAILSRRPASGVTGGTYATQNPDDPEQRAWLCLDTAAFSACTTHLDARSTTVARAQCRYLLGTVLPEMRAPVVLAGDLNLRAGLRNCLTTDERNADDGGFQSVVVDGTFAITATRVLDMRSTTDHPGLLVTLAPR